MSDQPFKSNINLDKINKPRVNILEGINKFVKNEIENENIPKDAKIIFIGTIDLEGAKIAAVVELSQKPTDYSLKLKAIFNHEWDGDTSVGAKVIFAK